MVAIKIDRFVKRYGIVQVVHDISFDIAEGEFMNAKASLTMFLWVG